jgi:hypothetical protein
MSASESSIENMACVLPREYVFKKPPQGTVKTVEGLERSLTFVEYEVRKFRRCSK